MNSVVSKESCDAVDAPTISPAVMIEMFTQSVAASPWPSSHECPSNGGGIFITSAVAASPPPQLPAASAVKRCHSRSRISLAQFNIVDEDPRLVLDRLQPVPIVRNESASKSHAAVLADERKKSTWFSFFSSLARRSNSLPAAGASGIESCAAAAAAAANFTPKSILKQPSEPVDDNSSVRSTRITTSSSPVAKPAKIRHTLRFDNEVKICETFHKDDYCRESADYVARQLTPSLATAIKRELNEIKQEMEVHEDARHLTQFYVIK